GSLFHRRNPRNGTRAVAHRHQRLDSRRRLQNRKPEARQRRRTHLELPRRRRPEALNRRRRLMRRILFLVSLLATALSLRATEPEHETIDRNALVTRHNPKNHEAAPLNPFSLGNGRFAFTADITGLQSFPDHSAPAIPLATLSEWGWHSFPNTNGYSLQD